MPPRRPDPSDGSVCNRGATSLPEQGRSPTPHDDFLIAGMLGGDAAALNKLIERYDRLVRYTILRQSADRCRRDPQWLESIASTTWEGFVRSLRRDPQVRPKSVAAYLTQIARNQCISALRRASETHETTNLGDEVESLEFTATLDEPLEILSRLESLAALRGCLAELDAEDRIMASQLAAIMERRWKDAAGALGVTESTLRSRWKMTLARLRRCVTRKTGKSFAPLGLEGD